jgi:hypothetical protein
MEVTVWCFHSKFWKKRASIKVNEPKPFKYLSPDLFRGLLLIKMEAPEQVRGG